MTSAEKIAKEEFFMRHNGQDLTYKQGSKAHCCASAGFSKIQYIPFQIKGSADLSRLGSEEELIKYLRYNFPDDILVPQGSILQDFRYKIIIDRITKHPGETRGRWDDVMAYHWRVDYRVLSEPMKLVEIDEKGNEIREY